MSILDWIMLAVPVLITAIIGIKTQKYTRSVADFMSASRVAGRYLVATASNEAVFGITNVIGQFEIFFVSGFAAYNFWILANNAVWLFILLSGFIIYRYRESRVMTLGQFFEIRYSKAFRVFAGSLAFLSGIVAYGIYPAVGARFFIYYCGLPPVVHIFGHAIPSFLFMMVVLLTPGVVLTAMGGQLTAMVVDSLAGFISMIFYIVVVVVLLMSFHWSSVAHSMLQRPAGESMFNPFDESKIGSFNFWYMAIQIFGFAYGWQSQQAGYGFRSAAINAHEQKMGAILGPWRNEARTLLLTVTAMCAFCFLHYSLYSAGAQKVMTILHSVHNPAIRAQLVGPVALSLMLPIGVKGMFAAIMLFAQISTDVTMMHSWGSIFIQDVVVPLRKRPMETRQHLFALRTAVVGVAVFAFLFSALFPQTQYIMMFLALAAAIFSGAGATIIGGFYWKRGTSAGAWGAMVSGLLVTIGGFILQRAWEPFLYPWLQHDHPRLLRGISSILAGISAHVPQLNWMIRPDHFPFNSNWIWFFSIITAIGFYLGLSLLTYRQPFNLDQMLHRGQYAAPEEAAMKALIPKKISIRALMGITKDFTTGDLAISWSLFIYRFGWFVAFVSIVAWNIVHPWPANWWVNFSYIGYVFIEFFIGVTVTVWFTWGSIVDLKKLFAKLRVVRRNALDDGTVVGHRNLDEVGLAAIDLPPNSQDHHT